MAELRYKVGDKIRIKGINWYNLHKNNCGRVEKSGLIKSMARYCGKRTKVIDINKSPHAYRLDIDNGTFLWMESTIE